LPIAPALADAGANEPGTEHGYADAMRLELRRQPLRHANHRVLAGDVRAEPEPAVHPGHGRGVDDVAAFTVAADVRKEGTDTVQHSHQIDVEHPTPIVERDIVDTAAGGDTGIVADHMDISERLVGCLGRTLDADGIGDVTGNAAYVRPKTLQAFDRGGQRIGFDIGEHHFHAGLRKGPAERESDATGPARDECCLAGEFPHDFPAAFGF
jgi:hypothetical protein